MGRKWEWRVKPPCLMSGPWRLWETEERDWMVMKVKSDQGIPTFPSLSEAMDWIEQQETKDAQ